MRRVPRTYRIMYSKDGKVSVYVLQATSKYNAKQRFYLLFPRAEILKVEVEDE